MEKRPFGKQKRMVSEVGLGCWQLGSDWGNVSEKEAMNILESAVESGIDFFDTADVYGNGRSETLIGNFLDSNKSSVFVATKAGRKGLYPDQYSLQTLRKCITDSLERLQVDTLDLLQTHCIPFEVMKLGEVWQWLDSFQKEGLIRGYGASVETVEEALWCIDHVPGVQSLQVIFNVFRQKPIHTLFEKATAADVSIIARVPLASGLLSGKFSSSTTFEASDHRNYNADGAAFNVGETFAGIPFQDGVELVGELDRIRDSVVPLASWSLRWILDHPAVTTVIPGASSRAQVHGNVSASALHPIHSDIHQRVATFYHEKVASRIRGPY